MHLPSPKKPSTDPKRFRPPDSTFGSLVLSDKAGEVWNRGTAPPLAAPPFVETAAQAAVTRRELWGVVEGARVALRKLTNGRRGTAEIDSTVEALERALGRLPEPKSFRP